MATKLRQLLSLSLGLWTMGALGAAPNPDLEGAPTHIIEVKASTSEQRTRIANLGYSPEDVRSDRVFVWGSEADAEVLRQAGFNAEAHPLPTRLLLGDIATTRYHSYDRAVNELQEMEQKFSRLVTLSTLGRSVENRDIPLLRISGKTLGEAANAQLPVIFYMGCHHAREHLSVEMPLLFAHYLLDNYGKDATITRLVDSREIYIAPVTNPDGHVYDFTEDGRGRLWRKNRSANGDGSKGVDLNRNYGYGWGTGGSSTDPRSETYMGPQPFSEPETRAVRDFVSSQPRMTTLLTLHSYSELILYPWGHTKTPVGEGNKADLAIYEKMGRDMSQWNHYTSEPASSLYIASGDTTDWSYGTHGVISFTFELSPSDYAGGGFYPGDKAIDPTFQANLNPMLYLLEYADRPGRVLSEKTPSFLHTPATQGIPLADFRDILQ
ncbi:MAG: zinc carboxypeptidase [Bdellovibrionales bacterium]|nr:zinc carboxypeptidase [Bdellovibrionales bacterium]